MTKNQPMEEVKPIARMRIGYLDFLKFAAIGLVLVGHSVEQLSGDVFWDHPLWAFIYTFHMPLFMFLSGLFFSSSLKRSVRSVVGSKLVQLGVPSLTAFALGVVIMLGFRVTAIADLCELSFMGFMNSVWFLKCLFFCVVILRVGVGLFGHLEATALAASVLVQFIPGCDVVSVNFMLPCYCLGAVCGKHADLIARWRKPLLVMSALAFAALLPFWSGRLTVYAVPTKILSFAPFSFDTSNLLVTAYRLAIGAAGTLVCYLSAPMVYRWIEGTRVDAVVQTIGRETLGIYVVQTFLLEIAIHSLGIFVPQPWSFVVAPLLALAELCLCHAVVRLLNRNTITRLLFLGSRRAIVVLIALSLGSLTCVAGEGVARGDGGSRPYVLEPRPVKSAVEITAVYYPGTDQMSEWDVIAQTCPERKPLLGWFDEGNPEAIDWQIKWAVEHGITSFCVDWYWNKGYQRLTHWVNGFYKARYRKYLKWYMMYANHNQPGAHSTADQIAVTRYWIDHYFKTPEYYTIDGKPVVCYWDDGNLDRDFIAEAAAKGERLAAGEGIRRAFAISERLAKEAGLPGIHWQLMWRGTAYDPVFAVAKRQVGFSSAISYGFVGEARRLAPITAAREAGLTYDMVVEGMPKLWQAKAVQRELPWWLPIPTGWDDRPRSFSHATVIRGRTPEKFAAVCRAARTFCEKNGIRHAVIHPINEWQEGSYIEPNAEYGFGMYDAIREAFCTRPASGWPANVRPDEVGLGPYDYPPLYRSPAPSWDFGRDFGGWYRQPYGGGELEIQEGCLNFWVNWPRRNYNIRQRLVPFDAGKYGVFRVRMRITPNAKAGLGGVKTPDLRLKWGSPDRPIIGQDLSVDERRCVASCPVKADGQFHDYAIDLSAHPDWKGQIDELWFEACQVMHARVAVDWMRFEPRR